jgi:hypothetical protein
VVALACSRPLVQSSVLEKKSKKTRKTRKKEKRGREKGGREKEREIKTDGELIEATR